MRDCGSLALISGCLLDGPAPCGNAVRRGLLSQLRLLRWFGFLQRLQLMRYRLPQVAQQLCGRHGALRDDRVATRLGWREVLWGRDLAVSCNGGLSGESWPHVGEGRPLARRSAEIHVSVVGIGRIESDKGYYLRGCSVQHEVKERAGLAASPWCAGWERAEESAGCCNRDGETDNTMGKLEMRSLTACHNVIFEVRCRPISAFCEKSREIPDGMVCLHCPGRTVRCAPSCLRLAHAARCQSSGQNSKKRAPS
jgi:hypothetical protein